MQAEPESARLMANLCIWTNNTTKTNVEKNMCREPVCPVQGWGKFATLAYSAMIMDCTESLTWGSTAIIAGLLPNGPASTAAYSITIQSYRCGAHAVFAAAWLLPA